MDAVKKKVFVIDDDVDVREVVTFALEEEGYQVEAFENPQEALLLLTHLTAENYPGLILVDFLMPKMDGPTFINILKNDYTSTLGKIPLALCSAKAQGEVPPSTSEDISHLHKPMELDDLLDLVRRHCD